MADSEEENSFSDYEYNYNEEYEAESKAEANRSEITYDTSLFRETGETKVVDAEYLMRATKNEIEKIVEALSVTFTQAASLLAHHRWVL